MEKLSLENRYKLYEWTLEKPLFWLVMLVTSFLGYITILLELPLTSQVQNLIFGFAELILVFLFVFSLGRIIYNLQYLEELESEFPDEIKKYLENTTSLFQIFLFGKRKVKPKKSKKWIILILRMGSGIAMILWAIIKYLKY